MPFVCSVVDCKNSVKSKQERGGNLLFHRFPVKNKKLTELWVRKCRKPDHLNVKNARICSDHFSLNSYKRDLQHELLNIPTRKILKEDAVPTLFLNQNRSASTSSSSPPSASTSSSPPQSASKSSSPPPSASKSSSSQYSPTSTFTTDPPEKKERIKIWKRKKLVETILVEHEKQQQLEKDKNYEELYKQACIRIQKCEKELKKQNLINSAQLQKMSKMDSRIKNQNNSINKLKTLLKTSKSSFKTKSTKTTSSSILSAAQEKRLKGFKKVKWAVEDIITALKVRSVSLKAYNTTLSSWKIPLPSVRTLQRWIRNFDCREGILTDVLEVLKEKSKDMDPVSRIVVICFDEMSLDSKYVLDPTLHKISSHNKVQVVMIRSLFQDWKQPIYFKFNTDVTKVLLMQLIREIEDCGLNVHAIISDLGRENQMLLKDLNIKEGSVCFSNPVDIKRNVYVITDIPHCLKNMKNHVIDDSVLLEDGTIIDKELLLHMVNQNGKDFKIHPHFTEQLINLSGADRMRVKPAAQFFSHRSSILASQVYPDNPSISDFFETINNGFDVLNSRVQHTENHLKSGFGTFFDKQKKALLKLRSLLATMRFKTKIGNIKKMVPSQLAFILSIDSTLLLFAELKSLHNISHMLTSRLTQDILESFFSVIRSLSGQNSHPDAPSFRYRLRLVLLGSRFKAPVGSNTQGENLDFSYLSSDLIRLNKFEKTMIKRENAEPVLDFDTRLQDDEVAEESQGTEIEELSYHQLSCYLFSKLNKDRNLYDKFESSSALLPVIKLLESEFSRLFPTFGSADFATEKISSNIQKKHASILPQLVDMFLNIRMRMKVRSLNEERKSRQQLSRRNRAKLKEFSKSSKSSPLVKEQKSDKKQPKNKTQKESATKKGTAKNKK